MPFQRCHAAAREGDLEVLKQLHSAKDVIAVKTLGGWTTLHYSAYKGHTAVAVWLLKNGARPNTTDFCGATPLHLSVMSDSCDTVGKLATVTDATLKDNDGNLAWELTITEPCRQ